MNCRLKQKKIEIRAWFNSVQALNLKLKKEYPKCMKDVATNFAKRLEVDRGDLSKVDLLFCNDGGSTYFIENSWLRELYNVKGDSGFRIQSPTAESLRRVEVHAECAPITVGYYSFEPDLEKRQSAFIEWIGRSN